MPRFLGLAAVAALAVVPGTLTAQGFQVNEHGTCVMGRAGVGTPKPCGDGSAIFYNPAGIGGMTGGVVSAGVTGIYAYGSFTDDWTGDVTDLENPLVPVPHAYFAYGFTPRLAAGIGFFVPYGLGTKWPETFEGRFNGYDNDLRSLYFQPTLAYQINDFVSVGAGFDLVLGSVKLTQMVDISEQGVPGQPVTFGQLGVPFHTQAARAEIEASNATGFGGNFGILITPASGVSIGARYLSRVKLDYSGTASFDSVGTGIVLPAQNPFQVPGGTPLDAVLSAGGLYSSTLVEQGGDASITMPDQVSVGIAVNPVPILTVLAEWQWVHWATFDTLVLDFESLPDKVIAENYRNTNGFRFGIEWDAARSVTVRGGYLYHQGAAPPETVTPLLPEGTRSEFTGGLGFKITEHLVGDVAYQYIRQNKRRGRVREPDPGTAPTVELNSGLYKFNAHLFGATLRWQF
jgi:long-chain fatty acid transport protein